MAETDDADRRACLEKAQTFIWRHFERMREKGTGVYLVSMSEPKFGSSSSESPTAALTGPLRGGTFGSSAEEQDSLLTFFGKLGWQEPQSVAIAAKRIRENDHRQFFTVF